MKGGLLVAAFVSLAVMTTLAAPARPRTAASASGVTPVDIPVTIPKHEDVETIVVCARGKVEAYLWQRLKEEFDYKPTEDDVSNEVIKQALNILDYTKNITMLHDCSDRSTITVLLSLAYTSAKEPKLVLIAPWYSNYWYSNKLVDPNVIDITDVEWRDYPFDYYNTAENVDYHLQYDDTYKQWYRIVESYPKYDETDKEWRRVEYDYSTRVIGDPDEESYGNPEEESYEKWNKLYEAFADEKYGEYCCGKGIYERLNEIDTGKKYRSWCFDSSAANPVVLSLSELSGLLEVKGSEEASCKLAFEYCCDYADQDA